MAGPEKQTDDARQGVTGTGTRYVLLISFAAALILLLAIAWVFFGPSTLDTETGRADGDGNPPYTASENPSEGWNEAPPAAAETP
ncbi:hypothetical protein [Parvibaculum sp.]|jgi:hypothetical protein|uniref:hypothetical protein n=1 Tax=Parvibaculum sp. TaxID=2024848 RepID=UPI000C3ED0A6|nr:hypothetical protein [Parvibaculum sp.]MAM94268.1 hypothetical protein [Parvibaculum sp.]HCX67329.1 hypothetical protein [Rhodobiaceae bacterium]|tara:strand:- start:5658 stop:5912 length:255 start_codon:yes stop_codon:yes gene_type:complete